MVGAQWHFERPGTRSEPRERFALGRRIEQPFQQFFPLALRDCGAGLFVGYGVQTSQHFHGRHRGLRMRVQRGWNRGDRAARGASEGIENRRWSITAVPFFGGFRWIRWWSAASTACQHRQASASVIIGLGCGDERRSTRATADAHRPEKLDWQAKFAQTKSSLVESPPMAHILCWFLTRESGRDLNVARRL